MACSACELATLVKENSVDTHERLPILLHQLWQGLLPAMHTVGGWGRGAQAVERMAVACVAAIRSQRRRRQRRHRTTPGVNSQVTANEGEDGRGERPALW